MRNSGLHCKNVRPYSKFTRDPGLFVDLAVIDFRKVFNLISHLSACRNLRWEPSVKLIVRTIFCLDGSRRYSSSTKKPPTPTGVICDITCWTPQGTKLGGITVGVCKYLKKLFSVFFFQLSYLTAKITVFSFTCI